MTTRAAWVLVAAALLSACVRASSGTPSPNPTAEAVSLSPTQAATPTPPSEATPAPSATSATCSPTDQDAYSRTGTRLQVRAACLRATGTVVAVTAEPDGDRHIPLRLDPGFEQLLVPGNAAQGGNLLLEAICVDVPTQPNAIAACRADPDPLRILPSVGQHIWAEGRWVIDLLHGWAEFHPLYRWGPLP